MRDLDASANQYVTQSAQKDTEHYLLIIGLILRRIKATLKSIIHFPLRK